MVPDAAPDGDGLVPKLLTELLAPLVLFALPLMLDDLFWNHHAAPEAAAMPVTATKV